MGYWLKPDSGNMGRSGFPPVWFNTVPSWLNLLIFKTRSCIWNSNASLGFFPLWPSPGTLRERTGSATNVGVKLSLNFSSHPRPITGLPPMYGLLWFARASCPRSDWQPVWKGGRWGAVVGGDYLCVLPRWTWRGFTWRLKEGGNTPERTRSAAAQFRRAERRGAELERRVTIRQLAGGTHTIQTLMAAWEITIHPPSPFFLFLWDFWLLVLSWPEVVASLISCSTLKNWIHLPRMSLAVMDTHIRWKVKRRIRDAQITLAVILLFVTSQASSGKMQLWVLWTQLGAALCWKVFPPLVSCGGSLWCPPPSPKLILLVHFIVALMHSSWCARNARICQSISKDCKFFIRESVFFWERLILILSLIWI